MNDQIKTRLKRIIAVAAVALAITALGLFIEARLNDKTITKPSEKPSVINIAGLQVGGSYALVDENGQDVSNADYKGRYKLVFFGFTSCPEVCPTELQKMTKVLKILGTNAEKVTPLLVSIDPMRDTPDVMKNYTDQFDSRIIGLTGTETQVDAMEKNFRVYAAKVEDDTFADYTMTHSSFTYLMGPNDEFLGLYRAEDKAEDIAADIKKKLSP